MIESAARPRLADRDRGGAFLAGRVWRAFLLFLEVVGLRRERNGRAEVQLSRLRLNHAEFRKLLSANDSFLHILAELEAGRDGRYGVDGACVHRRVVRAAADVFRMVESLDAISGGRYPGLRATYQRVSSALAAVVRETSGHPRERLVLDLSDLQARHADRAGGKMAHLGEVRNVVGLPTPDGFVVTTEAYHLLARGRAPGEAEAGQSAAPLPTTAVPSEIRSAIEAAHDRLAARLGARPRLAVRSSALGEDGRRSYAGQFLSILDVPRQDLAAAYLDVVRSLDSAHATEYRRMHGIPDDCAAMAVGFLAMVDARVAGITYSREPDRPDSGQVLIQVVHGLGVTLADGGSWAEAIRVSRDGRVSRLRGQQAERVVCGVSPGVQTEPVGSEAESAPCLGDEEARQLARWALVLEGHFGLPQDIEWARDQDGRLSLLQARPLRTAQAPAPSREPAPGAAVLVRGGETACPGVGSGPATLVEADNDLSSFPMGGVLLVRRPSPSFVRLMGRASAIVSDAGSTTGHMATLAREFGVPTLLNLGTAVRDIPAGSEVTVDASAGVVYAGKVDLPQGGPPSHPDAGPEPHGGRETEAQWLLERVVELIIPLSLTDPRSPSFSLEGCQTLHDLARYIHERSYAEMFRMGEDLQDLRDASYFLEAFLPMELYVIDLGGGVAGPVSGRRLRLPQIACLPLRRLLQGMLDRRIPRFGARPIDVGGLVSVMLRHALTSPEQDPTFRDPCYAMASDCYLNYTARVGYHFGVVDTYCSPTPNRNYVTFRFKGGAADRVRRARRARAIAGILRREGFTVEVEGDLVGARLSKASREEILSRLEMLGRLLQFFRQMDAAMGSDQAADQIQEAFLNGDFALDGAGRGTA